MSEPASRIVRMPKQATLIVDFGDGEVRTVCFRSIAGLSYNQHIDDDVRVDLNGPATIRQATRSDRKLLPAPPTP